MDSSRSRILIFFYYDITPPINNNYNRYIVEPNDGGGHNSWLLTDDNPNKPAYDAWLAEGNTPEEWTAE
jgi:hypothetical protein